MIYSGDILNLIEKNMPVITDIVKDIGNHPELGYKEFRTAGIVNDYLCQTGYTTETGLAITGIKAKLTDRTDLPTIALIGELDGIICSECTWADSRTGATHNCGHHLQLGVLLAVASAFKESGISCELGGNISFIAAPAEEYIELDYRTELKRSGKIRYMGGKQELIYRGVFDDIDAALMVHSQSNEAGPYTGLIQSGNGFIAERIRYTGKTAHAATPEEGINALHAAIIGINGVNSLRDTFRDENHSRVHYIITKGGDAVNNVPADVRMECFVRSNSIDSIRETLEKTNRAFISGGEALGARTEIDLLSGYLPLACNAEMNALFAENAAKLMSLDRIMPVTHFNASTDMGDITHLMPAIHPLTGGVKSSLHAADFEVVDYQAAIEIPAKIIALTLIDLLSEKAQKMKTIIASNPPLLTKKEYFKWLDINSNE